MTANFDATYYESIRGRVRGVLIVVAEHFPAQQVGIVDELIDVNEAGVALEMLTGMLVEAGVMVDKETINQIERLVQDMGLSSEISKKVEELKGAD